MGEILDALLGAIGLVDVDARVGVGDGFGRSLGHGVSGYDVREPDLQEKNFQIVARSRMRKRSFTAVHDTEVNLISPEACLCGPRVSLRPLRLKSLELLTAKFAEESQRSQRKLS